VEVTCTGEPVRISMCHCHDCQRRTGSVFGVQARWPVSQVTVSGEVSEYLRVGDSGGRLTFRFCPRCGSTMYYSHDGMPETFGVPVGAFADASFPAPVFSVYDDRMHPWVRLPDGIERMT
jgi:hypothetical protein